MKKSFLFCCAVVALAASAEWLPVPLVWQIDAKTLTRRQYIRDVDYLKSLFLAACTPKELGGYGWCTNAQGQAIAVFTGPQDPDYVKVRRLIAEADARQRKLGRLEYPGYRPQPYYVYWMRRFGILPPETDLHETPVDCFAADKAYWESLWYNPR